jgi:hypothetical protein
MASSNEMENSRQSNPPLRPVIIVETTGYYVSHSQCACYRKEEGEEKILDEGWSSSTVFSDAEAIIGSMLFKRMRVASSLSSLIDICREENPPDSFLLLGHPIYHNARIITPITLTQYTKVLEAEKRQYMIPSSIDLAEALRQESNHAGERKFDQQFLWPRLVIDTKEEHPVPNVLAAGIMKDAGLYIAGTIVIDTMPNPLALIEKCLSCHKSLPIDNIAHFLSVFHLYNPQSLPIERVGKVRYISAPYALPRPTIAFI